MTPLKPSVVSAISSDEDAEMERLTAPPSQPEVADQEAKHTAVDEFVAGLDHEQLEYAASAIQDALGAEGELAEDVETPPSPEDSGATKNVDGEME